ncbi:hypothetical protein PAXRUDRAFT_829602 [Paxillus rubicundulus Ve08.2h10]|uniref:Matrin-type domain-containing protein n=1 Tax=Paxillus rubicundulus Ve08.2h10 TaxID=930991 RepID=A0A0D0DUM8_9AGAM|nr:hypothetical protein PAXRUDRAFT_829602 [Paxillus rubicundulus Ve08.2h10]
MSEYWVSHKRYHCKYCNIYIADDKPSRQQHENGLRHKGNVERFVRGLYKEGEKRVREEEEEKGIMASVGKAADAAYALDLASGHAAASSYPTILSARASAPPSAKPKPVKPSDPYTNYTTAASLGYADTDAEEAQRRRGMGIPGEWTVVMPTPPSSSVEISTQCAGRTKVKAEDEVKVEEGHVDGGNKRRPEPTADIDEDDARTFKLRKKTIGIGLGGIYDSDIIPIKLKVKKEEREQDDARSVATMHGTVDGTSDSGEAQSIPPTLKWTKVQWKKASDHTPPTSVVETAREMKRDPFTATEIPFATMSAESSSLPTSIDGEPRQDVKSERDVASAATVPETVKKEEERCTLVPTELTSLFRKRKLPAGRRGA